MNEGNGVITLNWDGAVKMVPSCLVAPPAGAVMELCCGSRSGTDFEPMFAVRKSNHISLSSRCEMFVLHDSVFGI